MKTNNITMANKLIFGIISAATIASACCNCVSPVIPADSKIERKVEEVLGKMTLEEKAGQLVQITSDVISTDAKLDTAKVRACVRDWKVGSFLNVFGGHSDSREGTARDMKLIQDISMEELGIPTVFGLDMIHGASYLSDATFFPQEINLAATFDRGYASKMGEVMAYETRAAMVPWIFSPVMDLGRDPRWPRHWESWGEDPYLQAEMSVAETVAAQGEDPNHIDLNHVAVSIKHYLAYGTPVSGQDRTPGMVSPCDLREKYFRPFKECFQAGALTLMANSASVNGVPVHSSYEYLTQWCKKDLGWDGMVVTDWADINNLYTREHIAADRLEAVEIGINAGVDMIMDPYDPAVCADIVTLVKQGRISQERLDDAVRRVLRLKARLGLFENPVWSVDGYEKFACGEFAKISYDAAVESMVLLKNDSDLLPLAKGKRILVTGPNANSMRTLNGGWSYTWQGEQTDSFASGYNTILEALINEFGAKNVNYRPGVSYYGSDWKADRIEDLSGVVAAARNADVVIACVGENSYCETPGNINDLNLSENQKELVRALAKTGKPIILVLNEGRPRIINDIEPMASAVIDIMLPGNYGGDALAALISGRENFSGRLPFTYSKYVNALHTYDYKVSEVVSTMSGAYNYDAVMDVQWPFGAGLSYTKFEYSDFRISSESFAWDDELTFEVTVRNTGKRSGKETVMLFSSDLVASIVPDVRRLREFTKVELAAGESKTVKFTIPAKELAFVGRDGKWRIESGDFRFSCGTQALFAKCTGTKIWETPNID